MHPTVDVGALLRRHGDRTGAASNGQWRGAVTHLRHPPGDAEDSDHCEPGRRRRKLKTNALSQLSLLAEHRLTRSLQCADELPPVRFIGRRCANLISACTFGTDSMKLQALQVFSFSLLISLSLVAISDIHRPFHGLIRVSDHAFQRAQQIMQAP